MWECITGVSSVLLVQLMNFTEFLWDNYYVTYQPPQFAAELAGMAAYYEEHGKPAPVPGSYITVDMVERHFLVLANMPADEQNIIAALEQEFEKGWPVWLKDVINEIIKLVLHLKPGCDAYGVWGSRTKDSLLYSSRNLDYNSDTGINRNKLVIMYHVDDPSFGGKPAGGMYASLGFAFGLGALAGMNEVGITTSEMNLDNDVVTFSGVPFPWRLRLVLEGATDLHSAMNVWNATNNTNSFNFLVASAPDALRIKQEEELGVAAPGAGSAAFALETIMGFTAVFPANSTVELDATYDCVGDACKKWTSQTGIVHIGKPIPEAVWRTNHGLAPRVMATQEPLFNNTVFRYDLMNHLFVSLAEEGQLIDDTTAVQVVSTLGIKGVNYLTCDQDLDGDNIMSIAYAPGPRDGTTTGVGHLYIAWESYSGAAWRPAACSPYVPIDFADWV